MALIMPSHLCGATFIHFLQTRLARVFEELARVNSLNRKARDLEKNKDLEEALGKVKEATKKVVSLHLV